MFGISGPVLSPSYLVFFVVVLPVMCLGLWLHVLSRFLILATLHVYQHLSIEG